MIDVRADDRGTTSAWTVRPYDAPATAQREGVRLCAPTRSWFDARRDILLEGKVPAELRIIAAGLACRYKIMPDGSRCIIGLLFPGDPCNVDFFCAEEMDHSVRTVVRTEIVSVARHKLLEMMHANSAIAGAFWSSAAQDGAILRQWLVKMGHQKARGRVAHLLYEIFLRCQGVGMAGPESFILELTQDELADTLGMTPVHMNRVLQQLRKEGLIQIVGRRLTILNRHGLETAADFDPRYRAALRRPPLGVHLGLRIPERMTAAAGV